MPISTTIQVPRYIHTGALCIFGLAFLGLSAAAIYLWLTGRTVPAELLELLRSDAPVIGGLLLVPRPSVTPTDTTPAPESSDAPTMKGS